MEEDREIQNLINQLKKKESYPSLEFEFSLMDKLLKANQAEYQGFWGKFFFGLGKINMFSLSNTLGILLISLMLIGSFYYFLNNNYTLHEQVRTLTGNEQYGILTQVYTNNPQALLSYNRPLATSSIANTITSQSISDLFETPEGNTVKNFNYFHMSTAISYGPFSPNCVGMMTDNTSMELFTYEGDPNSDDSSKYLKLIEYNSDNTILDYQLVNGDNYFRYFGAANTILTKLNTTDNTLIPQSLTPTPVNEISYTFGDDLEVQEVVSGDKVLYKIIKTGANYFCYFNDTDPEIQEASSPGNITTILLIDPLQNFAVVEAQYYFELPVLANQIMVIRNNQERKALTQQEAGSLFQYDLPFPVEIELTKVDLMPEINGIFLNFTGKLKEEKGRD